MKSGRLHIRVDAGLVKKLRVYCKRHHVTITAVIEQHFLQLLREEEKQQKDLEVGEQI